ncbi:amino-acid N-acetyltransferase [Arcanobacterium haemolyticum]|nr:amino-acid N-acetyltransferase [Arcanobacterium haemolyticum]
MAHVITLRSARPADVHAIANLVRPYSERRILVAKNLINYYEDIQEFVVATKDDEIVGCGALHVLWQDIAEVRTLAVSSSLIGTGTGHRLLESLEARARELGLERLFCLTFEVEFFRRHGYSEISETPVDQEAYQHLLMSYDDGVAEFLDLARAKPNTLGNTRMMKYLNEPASAEY